MRVLQVILLLIVSSLVPDPMLAQITSTGVPFLLISSSPETNSLGGIASLTRVDDPLAMVGNAGMTGLQSLNRYVSASTFANKSDWLTNLGFSGLTYNARAIQAGFEFGKIIPIPFPFSLGIGYSETRFEYGKFSRTADDPTPIGTFEPYDQSKTWYVGIGFEYFVRAGFGVGFKNIDSYLGPFGVALPQSDTISVSARDWGAVVEIPFGLLISQAGLTPVLSLNLGYAQNNIGDKITYADQFQSDPLPRQAILGVAGEFGFRFFGPTSSLTLISLTIAREARDLLVTRTTLGEFEYESGVGEINFFDNVIGGQSTGRIESRKAWQLNVLDSFFLRRGSFAGGGYTPVVSTSGFGFRLNPMLNILRVVSEALGSSSLFGLLAEHLDVQYSYSQYSTAGPLDRTEFKGLVVIVK